MSYRVVIERLPDIVIKGLSRDADAGISGNEAGVTILSRHYGIESKATMRPARARAKHNRLILRVPPPVWYHLAADALINGTISGVARRIIANHYQRSAP